MSIALKLFISYSHKDESLKDELVAHLSPFKRSGVIDSWDDRMILPGDEWAGEIDENLEKANVILLLISSDFINSRYCYDIEMKRALERHADPTELATVVPVIVRECLWNASGSPIRHLQSVPKDGKAVTSSRWNSTDEAFTNAMRSLDKLFTELRKETNRHGISSRQYDNVPAVDHDAMVVESDKYNCDRKDPNEKYVDHIYINEDEGFQFTFLCGDEKDQVESFYKRVFEEVLRDLSNDKIKSIDIQDQRSTSFELGGRLESSIIRFRKILDREIKQFNPAGLTKEFTSGEYFSKDIFHRYNYVSLNFKIRSEDWLSKNHGPEFVEWLAGNFFHDCLQRTNEIKVIVFFSIILNNDESDPAGIRTEILDSLKKLPLFDDTSEFEAFICDLGKLEMVEYKDLKDWFGKYYGNAKQVEDVARIVFGEDQRNRTMAEVEEKLHPLVESYLNRENRI